MTALNSLTTVSWYFENTLNIIQISEKIKTKRSKMVIFCALFASCVSLLTVSCAVVVIPTQNAGTNQTVKAVLYECACDEFCIVDTVSYSICGEKLTVKSRLEKWTHGDFVVDKNMFSAVCALSKNIHPAPSIPLVRVYAYTGEGNYLALDYTGGDAPVKIAGSHTSMSLLDYTHLCNL